jgi:hypothetical protein
VLHQAVDATLVAPEQAVAARLERAAIQKPALEDLLDAGRALAEMSVSVSERFTESACVHLDAVGCHLVSLADVGERSPADKGCAFEHEHPLLEVTRQQCCGAETCDSGADDDDIEFL